MSNIQSSKQCRSLYKKYKKTCADVDVFQQCSIRPIMQMSIDELDKYIKETTLKFNKTKKCYDQRQKHREKCIDTNDYDIGHDKQFILLKQQLDLCEDVIKQGYKRLEKEMKKLNKMKRNLQELDTKNKFIQPDKNEITSLVKQSRKKVKTISNKKIQKLYASDDSVFQIFQDKNKIYNQIHEDLLEQIILKREDILYTFLDRYNIHYGDINIDDSDNINTKIYSIISQKVFIDIFMFDIINNVSPSLVIKMRDGSFGTNIDLNDIIDKYLNNKQLTDILHLTISFNNYTPYFNDIDYFIQNNT